jgi:rare lipoprotein A
MYPSTAFSPFTRRRLQVVAAGCCSLLPLTLFGASPQLPSARVAGQQAENGVASWHDPADAADRRTASHRPWDSRELVAAHKTLPLGTRVRVFNLSNGREVVVVITDRGPFRRGRIIDVSRSAAQKLGLINTGTAHVRVERLPAGAS